MLHASDIAQMHASEVAELKFANDLIRVFKGAVVLNDSENVSSAIKSLLSTVAASRLIRKEPSGFWENESHNLITSLELILRYARKSDGGFIVMG